MYDDDDEDDDGGGGVRDDKGEELKGRRNLSN